MKLGIMKMREKLSKYDNAQWNTTHINGKDKEDVYKVSDKYFPPEYQMKKLLLNKN